MERFLRASAEKIMDLANYILGALTIGQLVTGKSTWKLAGAGLGMFFALYITAWWLFKKEEKNMNWWLEEKEEE